jgi:hypothetical protein
VSKRKQDKKDRYRVLATTRKHCGFCCGMHGADGCGLHGTSGFAWKSEDEQDWRLMRLREPKTSSEEKRQLVIELARRGVHVTDVHD